MARGKALCTAVLNKRMLSLRFLELGWEGHYYVLGGHLTLATLINSGVPIKEAVPGTGDLFPGWVFFKLNSSHWSLFGEL